MRKRGLSLFSLLALAVPPPSAASAQQSAEPRYEMTTYYVGLLYRGPQWTAERTPETERVQAAHLAHIGEMAKSGKLLLAGPFTDDGHLRGIFVFKVDSLAEARALSEADPAVKAGRLVVELHPWYSAKGITIVQPPKPEKEPK